MWLVRPLHQNRHCFHPITAITTNTDERERERKRGVLGSCRIKYSEMVVVKTEMVVMKVVVMVVVVVLMAVVTSVGGGSGNGGDGWRNCGDRLAVVATEW